MSQGKIKIKSLITAFLLVFLLADLYPHPNLRPGLLVSSFSKMQQSLAGL